ncbi:MAG: hypothetical protein AAF756_20620 [Pseudomonadota bacterium]
MATQQQVAKHLGISTRQVRTLIKSGVLPAGTKGPDIDACRHAYLDYLRGKATGKVTVRSDTDLDGEQERARLAHHKANIAALEEQQLAGSLIEIAEVADAVGKEYAAVRARLLALPSRVAPLVSAVNDTAEVRGVLDDSVREALEELVADSDVPDTDA